MASITSALSPSSHADPPPPSTTVSTKRKRDDSVEAQSHPNGINELSGHESAGSPQSLVQDLVDVLKVYDPEPSVLLHHLSGRPFSAEPQAKRQKAEDSGEASTIISRAAADIYSTLDDVLQDVDSAVSDIIKELELPEDGVRDRFMPMSPEKLKISMKVSAFKNKAHDLVLKNSSASQKSKSASSSNGSSLLATNAVADARKLVLGLYGNTSGGPRQLYSSRQQTEEEGQETVPPVREAGLPNGIISARILSYSSQAVTNKKRGLTLGELFPTPASLPTLEPPKPSKVATTRSSIVGWYHPDTTDLLSKGSHHQKQAISTGLWLDYSNSSPLQGVKRKQRDRTLSLGGLKMAQFDADTVESEAVKLDSLFRGAYSSFAPSQDDAAAVVPQGLMNRIWWDRTGKKSFARIVESANGVQEVDTTENPDLGSVSVDADEDEQFRETVEYFEKEAMDLVPQTSVQKSAEDKDVDEILEGISELLQTLSSYQRIRNLSLNSLNRPTGLLSAPDTTSIGTPSKPSEPELATYQMLKTQLTLMIATLPPYAVAKLNSDQLAELSISTKIEVPVKAYNGIMQEDETSARAKLAALTASSTPRATQSGSVQRSTPSALYGNQYSAPRSAAPVSQPYYASQTPARSTSSNYQRPPATGPAAYPVQRPAAGAPYRQPPYGTPSYPHHTSRAVPQPYSQSPQYTQTPGAQPYPRPTSQSYQAGSQSTPQASLNARYSTPSSYAQQTAAQNGLGYPYKNSADSNRQPSPSKRYYSPQPPSAPASSYTASGQATSQAARSYLQNPLSQSPVANGASPQSPQPQQPLGPTNYSTFMTTAEQASMMERQRAQLAQQQGMQAQARSAAQAGSLGSPSKSQVNGSAVTAGL